MQKKIITYSSAGRESDIVLKFIYKGYRAEYYYWELVIITKKVIFIFIGSFTEFFPSESKATILLIIVALFLLLQTRLQPYEAKTLNNIEFLSLLVTFVSANVGIMLFSDDMKTVSKIFLVILILPLSSTGFIFLF